ncbi:hypothetical protein [Roseivivax roseus]|uniref:hypothetical protein n=1 Tax=Tranquillimonas rosea TaxID=641238 RepID=UPI000B8334FE
MLLREPGAARSFDRCAGDIAAAFLDAPGTAPDIGWSRAPYYTIPFEETADALAQPPAEADAATTPEAAE